MVFFMRIHLVNSGKCVKGGTRMSVLPVDKH